MTNEEIVTICVRERGYMVLGSTQPRKIGTVIDAVDRGRLPQPFAVTQQTDKADADEQHQVLAEHGLSEENYSALWPYFYRLSTD
jgi:hypothetical protein